MPATPWELFGNNAATVVTNGGTSALTSDNSFTVVSSSGFPAASSGASPPTQFRIADPLQPSEMMTVTNVSGTTWTVVRGDEGTSPVAHQPNWTAREVTTGGILAAFQYLLTWGFQPYYQSATITPVIGTASQYGTPFVFSPPSGYRFWMPLHIGLSTASVNTGASEKLTVQAIGTLADGTSAGSSSSYTSVTGDVDNQAYLYGTVGQGSGATGHTVWWGGTPSSPATSADKRLASLSMAVESNLGASPATTASVTVRFWAIPLP